MGLQREKIRCLTTYKNNAKTCLESKLRAPLLSGLSCGQSRSPARTVFIRNVAHNLKKLLNILILTLIFACQSEMEIYNPNGIWTEPELAELNQLVTEFDEILTAEYNTNSEKEAYLKYSKDVFQTNTIPVLNGMENLNSNVKNFEVFKNIWRKNSNSETKNYNLKPNSKYQKYLERIGEKSDYIKKYADHLKATNDISPSIIAGFSKNIDNIDLSDKNNRLVFAIHYLTLLNR